MTIVLQKDMKYGTKYVAVFSLVIVFSVSIFGAVENTSSCAGTLSYALMSVEGINCIFYQSDVWVSENIEMSDALFFIFSM